MDVIRTVLFWSFLSIISAKQAFKVQTDEDGFRISVDGIQILQHTKETPLLLVGKADMQFKEQLGNYDITEIESEKSTCLSFDLQNQNDALMVTFTTVRAESIKLTFRSDSQHPLVMEFTEVPESYNRIWIRLPAEAEEAVYGGGEQFTHFNLRGNDYPVWVREQGAGRDALSPVSYLAELFHCKGAGGDYHTTYYPQSTFVSSRKYYMHAEGYNYAHLDFRNPNYHEIAFQEVPKRILFNADPSLQTLITELTGYLKRQPPLPDWVNDGVILGIQGGTEKMLSYLATAKEAGLKVNGLWIQDWSGSIYTSFGKRVFWNWQWCPEKYPGLDVEIKRLKAEGVHLLAYVNTHFSTAGPIYKEADQLGYFVKNSSGQSYIQDYGEFSCGSVDLTYPAAYNWLKDLMIRNLVELGFSGWMADFGEYLPVDGVYHNGADPVRMHNEYPVLWAKLNYDVLRETDKLGEIMFFMRAGGTGTSQYSTMMWAGDQNVDWSYTDGIATTVPAALSFAMSGIGRTHFDIGGYTTAYVNEQRGNLRVNFNMTRTRELFFRYAETAIFTPAMRTHEGNVPSVNYQVYQDPQGIKEFARLVDIFIKLKPYRKFVDDEYVNKGLPMQRPLFLNYENDPVTYEINYQFLFGSDILVAPITDQGKTEVSVYLPDDNWVHFFTGQKFTGPQWVTIECPIGVPTAFYREASQFASLFREIQQSPGHCDADSC